MPIKKQILLIVLILFMMVCTVTSDSMNLEWSYNIGKKILKMSVEDLDNDGSSEIILLSGNSIHVIDSKGNLKWQYSLNNIQDICISDIDNDNYNEIVLSTGQIMEGISRGRIYVFDRNGRVKWVFPSGRAKSKIVMEDIDALDLDLNKYEEIVGATIFGVSAVKDTYDGFLWNTAIDRIDRIIVTDFNEDSYKEIVAVSLTRIYIIDHDGSVVWMYDTGDTINTVNTADIYAGGRKEFYITTWGGEIFVVNSEGELRDSGEFHGNADLVVTGNLDNDFYDEVILASSDGKLYVLDKGTDVKWIYDVGKEIKDIYIMDAERDGTGILVSAGAQIYEISRDGELMYEYNTTHKIEKIFVGNLDKEDDLDFILYSAGWLYSLSINATYRKEKEAQWNYKKAYTHLIRGEYEDATGYAEKARAVYLEINDLEGFRRSEILLHRIQITMNVEKKKEADSYYNTAKRYYDGVDYENARHYIEKAMKIYQGINDIRGISTSNALLSKIENATKRTTTTVQTTTTTIPPVPPEPKNPTLLIGVVLLLIVIALVLYILWGERKEQDDFKEILK